MNVAIIPARGGSKRILRKNIRSFHGKPMIAYAIEAAQRSRLFQHIVVSTDDQEIAAIAQELGAEVPFLRPSDLADDFATTVSVIAHATKACLERGWVFDRICCVYPCVPFLQSSDLGKALQNLVDHQASYCFPIAQYPSPIQRALRLSAQGKIESFNQSYVAVRTQDLELAYFDVGQFYWGTVEAWSSELAVHSSATGHLIPSWRVVDIDTEDDWIRAELMYDAIRKLID